MHRTTFMSAISEPAIGAGTEKISDGGFLDAYNTALLFAKLEQDPDYELNEFYRTAREEETQHLSFCMGDLCANLVLS